MSVFGPVAKASGTLLGGGNVFTSRGGYRRNAFQLKEAGWEEVQEGEGIDSTFRAAIIRRDNEIRGGGASANCFAGAGGGDAKKFPFTIL